MLKNPQLLLVFPKYTLPILYISYFKPSPLKASCFPQFPLQLLKGR